MGISSHACVEAATITASSRIVAGACSVVISAAVCVSTASSASRDGTPDAEEMLSVLLAAVDQWRESVEFSCSYVLRQGWASSIENAMAGHWGTVAGRPHEEDRIVGVYHKRGDWVRLSRDWGNPPAVFPSGGGHMITNSSADSVSVGPLSLRHYIQHGWGDDFVRIHARRESSDTEHRAGRDDSEFSSFSAGGATGPWLRPLWELSGRMRAAGGRLECEITMRDANRMTFRLRGTMGNGSTVQMEQTVHVTFWTQPSLPVVERYHQVTLLNDGSRRELLLEMSDFVQCGGGMMARRARIVAGPHPPPANASESERAEEHPWLITDWISDDLGARGPQSSDFMVSLPAGVPVRGLHSPPPLDEPVTLDLSKLTLDDLLGSDDDSATAVQAPPRSRTRMLMGIFSVALLAIAIYFLGKRRQSPH